jgi:hypothetical protein
MESFRKNLSEKKLSENMFQQNCYLLEWNLSEGIIRKKIFWIKPFRNDFLSQLLGHKVVSERFLQKDSFWHIPF